MTLEPLRLGPVELLVSLLDGPRPSRRFVDAVAAYVRSGDVRLLDVVCVRRDADGMTRIVELDPDDIERSGLSLLAPGLAAEDDLRRICTVVPAGRSAAVLVIEFDRERAFHAELDRSGARVVAATHIPAVVANAVLDVALEQD